VHRTDSPWSTRHRAATTSTDRTALISFDRLPSRWSPSPSLGPPSRDDRRPPVSPPSPPPPPQQQPAGFFFRRGTTPEAATAAAAAAAQLTRDAGRDYDDGPGGPARSGPVGPIEPACPRNYLRLVLSRRRCTVAMLICLIA